MSDFFRFPHTPHLAWLADDQPRDDKVLSFNKSLELLAGEIVVEEKIDGANLGFSIDAYGTIRVQNRGQYIQSYNGQFSRLTPWLAQHGETLAVTLPHKLILFGEWCAAKHSLEYESLPDWLLIFDVYDQQQQKFWSTQRRNYLAAKMGLATVPELKRGNFSLPALKELLDSQPSAYRRGHLEGLVIRLESSNWCEARAKLVRVDFTQTISEHWRRRTLQWNRLKNK